MDAVYERAVTVLKAFYEHRGDGTLQTVAMALQRDADGPVLLMDVDKLVEVGALEPVDMPEFGDLGPPEVYRVTTAGEKLLRERGHPVG